MDELGKNKIDLNSSRELALRLADHIARCRPIELSRFFLVVVNSLVKKHSFPVSRLVDLANMILESILAMDENDKEEDDR